MPYVLPPRPAPTSEGGPFAPLAHLPRRKSADGRRPIFSLADDDDSPARSTARSRSSQDGDSSDDASPPATSPRITRAPALLPLSSIVPFPSIGGGPLSPDAPARSPVAAGLPRTPSTPVILSNGKPLKPSLKSSQSAPHLPPTAAHLRSQSAPSTPSLAPPPPKNVHFPERGEDLQRVRLFRPAGRPVAVSTGAADETETETEGYDSSAVPPTRAGFPFPASPPTDGPIALHPELSTPVPSPAVRGVVGTGGAHVLLETLQLPRARPSTLCGSVLVRNVAFGKAVAVRFTLDDWQTTSEVSARYVATMPALPPPFREPQGAAAGWDRWTFAIRLEDVERRLAEKTLWLAVRYVAHGDAGGEWWDNNAGANYRVVFRRDPAAPQPTPATATSAAVRSVPRSDPLPPLQLRAHARPPLVTSLSFGAQPTTKAPQQPLTPPTPKLSLRNYAPPAPVAQLPSPPDSARTSPTSTARLPLVPSAETIVGGHPTTPAVGPGASALSLPPVADANYAALVRQWCFHQPGADRTPKDAPNGLGLWDAAGSTGFGRAPPFGVGLGAEVA